jgi:uncharacterized protein YhaN
MRIRQLHVTRYGPMAPFSSDSFGDFTLIHGPNEQGKTLLIDALVRMLFKKDLRKTYRRYFGNMNRVAEKPEGFVVLESKGIDHKLENRETVKDVFPFDVLPDDFRNVFVVRDSDLSLKDADRYYSRVTEKLTGLRSSEIEHLMQQIQKRGRLRSARPDSELANNAEQGKIASKVRYARNLIDEIRDLREALLAENYDDLESELIDIRDRKARLEGEAALQRAAEESRRYRKARRALSDLKRMEKSAEALEYLDSARLKDWQKAISRRETAESDVAEEKREADKVERAIRNHKRGLNALEAKNAEARRRLDRINTDLKPKIDDYQYERAEFRRAEPQSGTYRKGLYAAAGLAALALLGFLVSESFVVGAVAVGAFAVWVALGIMQLKLRKSEGRVASKMDVLMVEARQCGLELETADEVISKVTDYEQQVAGLDRDLQARKADLENVIREKRRIEERIKTRTEMAAELNAEILSLQTSTGMDSIGDYQAALEKRTRMEASADAKRTILQEMLPSEATGEEAIEDWKVRIDAYLQATEEQERVEFDAKALDRIKAELASLDEQKRKLQTALLQGSRRLHGIEVKAKELGVLDASPPCRTTQELEHISRQIESFCERIEEDRRVAQDCIRLCEKIEKEERERVGDMFGEDSTISTTFSAITDGRYRSVHYDPGSNSIYLLDAENDRVAVESLSGGAYDQLFLTIRVAIASRLLADENGFLILDDPFVKADSERLPRLLDVLRRLSDGGWQILYFSAKDEVLQALSADIREGRVRKVTLEAAAGNPTKEDPAASEPAAPEPELFDTPPQPGEPGETPGADAAEAL